MQPGSLLKNLEIMYVCYLSHSTATKNKLEEEFFKHLQEIDRTWCENSQVDKVKQDILNKYQSLCEKYPRCKPIHKEFSSVRLNGKGDFILWHSNAVFTILKTK